jgi:hypothetical protein
VKILPNNKFPGDSSQAKRIWVQKFRDSGFWVQGSEVQGSEVQGSGFRVQRFRVQRFRV